MFIYGIHRIIGIKKTYSLNQKGRYNIVNQYKHHIQIYTIISGILCGGLFFYLPFSIQRIFIIPGLISILYTLPIFKNGRRLRDFHFIKIFLIAFVWAVTTAAIPAFLVEESQLIILLCGLERFFFFIAITIPFDIRDFNIDKEVNVKTLIHYLGIKKSLVLAICCLILALAIDVYFFQNAIISGNALVAFCISYSISGILILLFSQSSSDYYFTGVLDGTMILLAIILWLSIQF